MDKELKIWEINAPKRFNEFRSLVEAEGYFLGTYACDEENTNFVLTENEPNGTSQDAVFLFSVINMRAVTSPNGINKIVAYPIKNGVLHLGVEDAMCFFRRAEDKFNR